VWTRDLLIAIGLALVIIVFLYQPVKVEGTSMAPLLSDQAHLHQQVCYRFEPIQRGDVVVFWYPLDRSKSSSSASLRCPTRSCRFAAVSFMGRPGARGTIRPPQYEDLSDYGRCAFRVTCTSSWAIIASVQ